MITIDKLKQMDIKELKALAYDQIILIEQIQKNLQYINQIIQEKSQETNKTVIKNDWENN